VLVGACVGDKWGQSGGKLEGAVCGTCEGQLCLRGKEAGPPAHQAPHCLAAQASREGQPRFTYVVDKENVEERVAVILKRQDLLKWII